MPTMDIIGYLWFKRQDLDLQGLSDVLDMAASLQRTGLEVVRASDLSVFGTPIGASVELIRHERDEWDDLVHDAILSGAVEHTTHMLHRYEDDEDFLAGELNG